MPINLSYNGFSLQTTNILTDTIAHEDMPEDISAIFRLAHGNRNVVPYPDDFDPKTITIAGTLLANDIPSMDKLADTFRGYFTGSNKVLDIDYGGSTRRYLIAKSNGVKITRPNFLKYAKFSVDLVTESFGQNITATTLLDVTGRTSGSYSDSIVFVGNVPQQQPIITLTYTAVTGASAKSVYLANNNNGQQITVNRTWAAGDVLVIDVMNELVRVNGVDTDFTGAFTSFAPGGGVITYADDFTTRTFNENIITYGLFF